MHRGARWQCQLHPDSTVAAVLQTAAYLSQLSRGEPAGLEQCKGGAACAPEAKTLLHVASPGKTAELLAWLVVLVPQKGYEEEKLLFLRSMHALYSYRRDTLRRVTHTAKAWKAQDSKDPENEVAAGPLLLQQQAAAYKLLTLLAAKQLHRYMESTPVHFRTLRSAGARQLKREQLQHLWDGCWVSSWAHIRGALYAGRIAAREREERGLVVESCVHSIDIDRKAPCGRRLRPARERGACQRQQQQQHRTQHVCFDCDTL